MQLRNTTFQKLFLRQSKSYSPCNSATLLKKNISPYLSLSRKAEKVVELVLILVSTALSYISFPIYLNYSLKYCATAQLRNHTHTRVIFFLKLHNSALNKICPFLLPFPIYLHYSLKYCATAQLRNRTRTRVIYVLIRHIQMIKWSYPKLKP